MSKTHIPAEKMRRVQNELKRQMEINKRAKQENEMLTKAAADHAKMIEMLQKQLDEATKPAELMAERFHFPSGKIGGAL